MPLTKNLTLLTVAATLALAGSADAQFSFGGGGIQIGRGGGNNTLKTVRNFRQPSQQRNEANTLFHRTRRGSAAVPNWTNRKPAIVKPAVVKPRPAVCPTPIVHPVHPAPVYPAPAPVVIVNPAPPAPAPPAPVPPTPAPTPNRALELTFRAQDAFAKENYALAIDLMNRVVEDSPKSASAYQFRALSHFAVGNYDEAAADVYETLLRGNLWTWDTIHPLYKDNNTYTNQYRALYRAAADDSKSMSKHFVLAYHHLVLGHLKHGGEELEKVLVIQPEEPVTTQLLTVVRTRQQTEAVAMQ